EPKRYEPISHYEPQQIEGWMVLVNKRLLRDAPDLASRTLGLLQRQLRQVVDRLPARPVHQMRTVRIWVEEREPHHPCMAYHPDAGWLRRHDMNPDKARCVEVANAENFLRWIRDQPWMVFHELAHAYHHQFLDDGFANRDIQSAFDCAGEAGLYDLV